MWCRFFLILSLSYKIFDTRIIYLFDWSFGRRNQNIFYFHYSLRFLFLFFKNSNTTSFIWYSLITFFETYITFCHTQFPGTPTVFYSRFSKIHNNHSTNYIQFRTKYFVLLFSYVSPHFRKNYFKQKKSTLNYFDFILDRVTNDNYFIL